MRAHPCRRIATAVVLVLIVACARPQRRPDDSADPKQRVVTSLNEARRALVEWRAQVGVTGEVDAESYRAVSEATQGVGFELKSLSAHVKSRATTSTAREPALRASPPPSTSRATSKRWIDEMRALGDGAAARREAAIVALRAALTDSDPDAQLAALLTLQSVGDIAYDKASFRPLVLPFVEAASGATLNSALYALYNTQYEPGDLARVQAAWRRDPTALHDSVLHLLTMFGDRKLEGPSEDIALEWLSTYDGGNRGINGMWGARVGPRLEARVIELARSADHEVRHAAIYFGLSTFDEKSMAVVEELIAALTDPDHNNSGRALWGLGHGVSEGAKPHVVAALIDLHNNRSDRQTRESCLRTVRAYGGEEAAAKLVR